MPRQGLLLLLGSALAPLGCDGSFSGWGLFGFEPGGLSGRTVLTSSSLSQAGQSGQPAPAFDGADGLRITPDNVTGKVLSVLFPIQDTQDEGVVVFGDERPDIAPADAELFDFDLARRLPIESRIALEPGFVGGRASQLVLLLGYLDVAFTLNGRSRAVRVALADVDPLRRGDVLLQMGQDASGDPDRSAAADSPAVGTFRWYDTGSGQFVARRPERPAAIAEIRDFSDPVRPRLVFYPLNVQLDEPVRLDGDELRHASAMLTEIDFYLTQAVLLTGQHAQDIDDATLITSFNLAQITTGYGQSGFQARTSVELVGFIPTPSSDVGPGGGSDGSGSDGGNSPISIEPDPTPP